MLTNIGILASGKGMVAVPNLSGLSKTAAVTAITNAGLIPVDGGSTTTENSALNDIIASQLPNAGELVPYESQVTYIWYEYVSAPPFFPFFPPSFPSCTYTCGEWSYTNLVIGDCVVTNPDDPTNGLRTVSWDSRTRTCTAPEPGCSSYTENEGSGSYVENCTISTPTCTQDQIVSQGDCVYDGGLGGYFRTVTRYNADCTTYTQYEPCEAPPFFPPFFPFFPFFPPFFPFFPFFPPFFPNFSGCTGSLTNQTDCENCGGFWTGSQCIL